MGLLPKNTTFYDLFDVAGQNILAASDVLQRLIHAESGERADLGRELKEIEHRGDQTTHDIMRALNTSFITPLDREDIALLAARLDDVVDDIEAAADLTVLYRIDPLPDAFARQADLLHQAAVATAQAMPRLRSLRDLESYWITINEIENSADAVYRALLAELFDSGRDVIEVIKIKEVVDQLEAAADAFERVANVIQSVSAKES
jgi:hypothetical protein